MSSTNFTVPRGVKKIDCFCVGGGGGVRWFNTFAGFGETGETSSGGGAGYTTTVLGADVNPGDILTVTVGAGGDGIDGEKSYASGKSGSSSSVGNICSANGGESPWHNGGSGGGGGTYGTAMNNGWWEGLPGGAGGIDGGDGEKAEHGYGTRGGKGQHTTTRYFGESDGTLYASGGCGYNAINRWAASAPGDGGDGSGGDGGKGASGICIIRWGKQ